MHIVMAILKVHKERDDELYSCTNKLLDTLAYEAPSSGYLRRPFFVARRLVAVGGSVLGGTGDRHCFHHVVPELAHPSVAQVLAKPVPDLVL